MVKRVNFHRWRGLGGGIMSNEVMNNEQSTMNNSGEDEEHDMSIFFKNKR